ncbi:MAG: nucleotidyltransferase family protein [Chloroflexi bacterium]|nr:nucleotidyltransferase family protein [Chloroflexota bacterium]
MVTNITILENQIKAFCQRWGISELALFGSVLRDDFSPDSDVDVLVTFKPGREPRFADLLKMEAELEMIFGRKVDLGEREVIEKDPNYVRRKAILKSAQVIYAER